MGIVSHSHMAWNVKQCGKPTIDNIDKWVTVFEQSCLPGGGNAHLGLDPVLNCEICLNGSHESIAVWERKTFRKDEPLFQVYPESCHLI